MRSIAVFLLLHFILQIVQGFSPTNTSSVQRYERLQITGETQNVPRTCVIGAGYSGLATAKYLKEYNMDFTVFESSKYLGGVWHFDPRFGVDEDGIPIFSKMYKNLRLNTPFLLSEFRDFPLPEGTSSYPSSECVFKYLSSFATKFGLLQHIQFGRLVTSVKRLEDRWQLTYFRGDTKDTVLETCDNVVIATGLFTNSVWPVIQGADTFQGTISHSHTYRGNIEVYRSRRVLIVGNGFSARDLATQISKAASKLFHSHHRLRNYPVFFNTYVKKPDIQSFTHNGVIFADGSFEEVDDVIYCTGYTNWHQFLDDSSGLIRSRSFIVPLYRKMVNIKHPSMSFVGASNGAIHKILQIQAKYVASLIAGRLQLPSEDDMMKSWINEANHLRKIEYINHFKEYPDCKDWWWNGHKPSQEASILTVPPVFCSMTYFNRRNTAIDYINAKDYNWYIIDDNNFGRVYVGPSELTCPFE